LTAAQETTATSGDSRTDEIPLSRKDINNSGDACRQQQRTQQHLGFKEMLTATVIAIEGTPAKQQT
jgi:hypothetical protein